MDIIDRINLRLAVIGKTGAEMSRDLGFSNATYSQWNTKKTKPSNKALALVAPYLGTTVEYLLTGEEQKKEPPAESGELTQTQKEAIEFIKTLSEDKLIRFIKMGQAAFEEENDSNQSL